MSLTIENLEAQIGRRLVKGDVLISRRIDGEIVASEVAEPFVRTKAKIHDKKYRTHGPAVNSVELTTYGPISTDFIQSERGWNGFFGLIKVEDRTRI